MVKLWSLLWVSVHKNLEKMALLALKVLRIDTPPQGHWARLCLYLLSSCRRCWRSASRRSPGRICCRVWCGAPSSGPAASPCSSVASWHWRTSWKPAEGGRGRVGAPGQVAKSCSDFPDSPAGVVWRWRHALRKGDVSLSSALTALTCVCVRSASRSLSPIRHFFPTSIKDTRAAARLSDVIQEKLFMLNRFQAAYEEAVVFFQIPLFGISS